MTRKTYYHGGDNATRENVTRYLASHYGKARMVIAEALEAAVNQETLASGIRLGSFANYVGDRIAARQRWKELEDAMEDADRDPEEDSEFD